MAYFSTFREAKKNSPKNILFINANIIDPVDEFEERGEVLVSEGVIKYVEKKIAEKYIPAETFIVDCKNNYLFPALVDAQVRTGEPSGSYKESIFSTTKAAVAGGVATINLMPDITPSIDSTSMVEFIKNRTFEKSHCKITLFGSITKNLEGRELSEIGLLHKAGAKAVSDANNYIQDSLVFKRACEYASNFGIKIVHSPHEKFLYESGVVAESSYSTKMGLTSIPVCFEEIGLNRDLSIAQTTAVKYHALNISTKKAVEILEKYKNNKNISASTTPNHLCLDYSEIENFSTFAKIFPPLQSKDDVKAIVKALKNDTINFISSNHSPRSEDQKRLPVNSAEQGVIGLETLFSATVTKLLSEKFSLLKIVKLLSLNPAKFLGLEKIGGIKKGYVADLILVDINKKVTVNGDYFHGGAKNSAFDGKTLQGKILKTYIEGRLVYEN